MVPSLEEPVASCKDSPIHRELQCQPMLLVTQTWGRGVPVRLYPPE